MRIRNAIQRYGVFFAMFCIVQMTPGFAQNLQILGGSYNEAQYTGYPIEGTYTVQLTKDNYTFTSDQFEIIIALPQQGAYDASRASTVQVIPEEFDLIVNSPTSLILKLKPGMTYSGTGSGTNRRRDFILPIVTSAAVVDNPSLVTVQWNDFFVEENPQGNSAGSVLNVGALPVTLVSFRAAKEGEVAQLTWATTEETNSDRFEVQRSLDGTGWAKIGVVASNGESTSLREYRYTDQKPLNGVNLYRLRMVDKDETFAFSSIKSVRFDDLANRAYVYPNPSTDKVFLNAQDLSGVKQVSVVDLNGRAVLTAKPSAAGIDVIGVAAGAYVLKVSNVDGSSSTHKFVINR